jgi:acetyl esterase/lipase
MNRFTRRSFVAIVASIMAGTLLALPIARADDAPTLKRTQDVIYGRKFGTALTLDVFRPAKANGKGIIFIVSGGWFSSHDNINPGFENTFIKPLADHGYTVFAVVHGSQPKFIISECQQDLFRSVRFIRHNAKQFEIDPNQLGCVGASAGGHLSLTLATMGGPGDPNAKDPIDQESSAVQAAAAFFPPTDFLNYGKEGEDAIGVGILKNFKPAFGPDSETPESRQKLGHEISPIYHAHEKMPPVLLIHGDADTLVPVQQSQRFAEKCKSLNVPVTLLVRPGKNHGWGHMEIDMADVAAWFDQQLKSL